MARADSVDSSIAMATGNTLNIRIVISGTSLLIMILLQVVMAEPGYSRIQVEE